MILGLLYTMLTIKPKPTFEAPVHITVPGQPKPVEVTFTFHCLDRDALKSWVEKAAECSGDAEFLGRVIAGWSGIGDEAGVPLPYSAAALDTFVKAYPAAGAEIYQQYLAALTESRVKN